MSTEPSLKEVGEDSIRFPSDISVIKYKNTYEDDAEEEDWTIEWESDPGSGCSFSYPSQVWWCHVGVPENFRSQYNQDKGYEELFNLSESGELIYTQID